MIFILSELEKLWILKYSKKELIRFVLVLFVIGLQISMANNMERAKQIKSNRLAQHKCNVCSLAFSKKSNLTRHHRTHTNLRPFECDECGARFKHKYYVATHRLACHSNEHRFECWLCHRTWVLMEWWQLSKIRKFSLNLFKWETPFFHRFKLKNMLKKHFIIHVLSIKKRKLKFQ